MEPAKKKKKGKKSSKATSAGSKKKGRISKAERLRIQKEEEEKRLREEEEARLLAEKLEAERLERERQVREERERLEAKELEHREEQLEDLRLLYGEKFTASEKWKSEVRANAKWDRYMQCDGRPDPTSPQEINTFITLWKDEETGDFQSLTQNVHLSLNLIEKLEFLLLDTPHDEFFEHEITQYKETIDELQSLIYAKYILATEHLLQRATVLADIETGNMQQIIKDEKSILRIWANLNKNPRFKGFTFEDEVIGFDLPKPMALSNIAISILHTIYDHLSQQCSTYTLPLKKEIEESKQETDPNLESTGEDVLIGEEDKNEDKNEEWITLPVDEETKLEGKESDLSIPSLKEEAESIPEGQKKVRGELYKSTGDLTEEITESTTDNATEAIEDLRYQEGILHEEVVDLRQYTPLGGVYYLDVLQLPPQAKQAKGWTIIQLLEGGLQKYPYPPETASTPIPSEPKTENEGEQPVYPVYPPVGIHFKIPHGVVFFEQPQVARWDSEGKHWTTNNISHVHYKDEDREMSFQMSSFFTFTLLQDAHLNMPYESWELRPKGINKVTFVIYTAFSEIKIDIKDTHCRLKRLSNAEKFNVSNLLGRWISPFALKTAMKRAGINIFPEEDSDKYVSINHKDENTENATYEQMAILSQSFAFGWSKWNLKCGSKNISLKVAEHLKIEHVKEEDWCLYMVNAEQAYRLQIEESSEEFSEDLYENSEIHSSLYHMVKQYASDAAMEKLGSADFLFVDSVYQMLRFTKVITYS